MPRYHPYVPWGWDAQDQDRPCLADDRVALDRGQVASRVDAIAAQLAGWGVGPGDVVALMLPNRVELVLVLFAAWRLGATVTPVNPELTATETTHQLDDAHARLVVHDGTPPAGGGAAIGVEELVTHHPGVDDLPEPPAREDADAALALLVYTSGSTGRPKGVMLDHANLAAMVAQMIGHFGLTARDRCLLFLPLFHVNAILVSVLSPLAAGASTTVMARFQSAPFLERLARVRPTYFSGVPAIYATLAALPPSTVPATDSLRFAVCGAAPVSRELLATCEERFGLVLVEGYGLTEGTCASACNPVDGVRRLGTVGPALDGQRIAVADEDGAHLPPGEVGEVLVAGPTVMRGYLGMPRATADVLRDGWLHTGDVGHLDADGYLTLVDRLKDMIIRGGENIYPKELESTLAQVDGVLESAVVGRPDERLGEVPVAYVVTHPEATVTADQLLAHCRTHLTRVKVPVDLQVVDTLPRNPVGKIDKPALRRQLADAGAG